MPGQPMVGGNAGIIDENAEKPSAKRNHDDRACHCQSPYDIDQGSSYLRV